MQLKDLIGISLISLFLFPVVLVGIMLAMGVVHLEYGDGKDKPQEAYLRTHNDYKETEAEQTKTFQALQMKEEALRAKESEVNREIERLENLKLETIKAKEEIMANRKRIEELVQDSEMLQSKKIASLAEVYGAMRPEEAAPILLSLEDVMIVQILQKIPEARATSKVMAAMAALDVKRAARITEKMGKKPLDGKAAKGPEKKPGA